MRRGPRARKARAALAAWTRAAALVLSALTVVAAGSWAAWARVVPYVERHDYFRLRTIRVSSDETRVAPQTLAEIAGLYDDASLWDVDPDAIQKTLKNESWVHEASVSRHFPWQVSLAVSRRHAVAAAVAGSKAYLVDDGGVLFHEIDEARVPDLPYLTGWDSREAHAEQAERLRALLGVLEQAEERGVDVSELHMDDDGTVWLYATAIKASVRLGQASRAATGLDRLDVAMKQLGGLADRARLIDTDYRDRIVIRGADDKLPAMLAARDEGLVPREREASAPETSNLHGAAAGRPLAAQAANTTHDRKAARHG